MPLADSRVVAIEIPLDESLGSFLGKVRVWLDNQKFRPTAFTTGVNGRGYTIKIGFGTAYEANRFRHQFRREIESARAPPVIENRAG